VDFLGLNDLGKDDKLVWCGKNVATFDLAFLSESLDQIYTFEDLNSCFAHRMLDIGPMFSLSTDKRPSDLKTCLERSGYPLINVEHTALADCFNCLVCLDYYFHTTKE